MEKEKEKDVHSEKKKQKIHLLSQGSYGCIFQPNLSCKGNIGSSSFITKIQKEKSSSNRETTIGKKIQNIKHYSHYFAPILNTCTISLGTVENDEIKKCDFINNTSKKFISNKIKYVGKNTLDDYLLAVYQHSPATFLKTLIHTYLDLLKSLSLLLENNIIHMDLKENNIMIDEHLEKPIIIDFGLSFDKNDLLHESFDDVNLQRFKPTKNSIRLADLHSSGSMTDKEINPSTKGADLHLQRFKKIFFVYGYDYPPWCFEISVITYIINEIHGNLADTIAPKHVLSTLCDNFIEKNDLFLSLFSSTERELFKRKLVDYMYKFDGFSWKYVLDKMLHSISTWDNYSIAVIYLYFIHTVFGSSNNTTNFDPFIHDFIGFLKSIVSSLPEERKNIKDTQVFFSQLFGTIDSKKNHLFVKKIGIHAKNPDYFTNIGKKIATMKSKDTVKDNLFQRFLHK